MPTFYVDEIDIEPYEYVESCSKKERKELIEELIESGYLPPSVKNFGEPDEKKNGFHPAEFMYESALDKLHGKYTVLTKEEEDIILKIANRF